LLKYPELEQSIEWTRPTLILRRGVSPSISVPTPANIELVRRASQLRVMGRRPAAISDRYDALQAFEKFAAHILAATLVLNDDPLLLAFTVNDPAGGVGKTRLLEEIAVRSFTEGFLPVLSRMTDQFTPPANFLEFALQVSDAMDEIRNKFAVLPAASPNVHSQQTFFTRSRARAFTKLDVTPNLQDQSEFNDQLAAVRHKISQAGQTVPQVDLQSVLANIQEDFKQLVRDGRKKYGVSCRPLLLLDDVHRYEPVARVLLENAGVNGIGTENLRIPVILTYISATAEGLRIREALKSMNVPEERQPELRAFHDCTEQRLGYGQLILSWKRLVPNERSKFLNGFFDNLQEMTQGRFKKLLSMETEAFIKGARSAGDTLIEADYDALIKEFQ
jgi:hypothetical protein